MMTPDRELLRRYAEDRSEEAFAELVRRHVDLVYSAALRQVNGDAHLAHDVAQMVFVALARDASRLAHRPVLAGWLYTCAHFCAAKAVRTEHRRRSHEQEVHAMDNLLHDHGPEPDWEKVLPVLDKVMIELNEPDREAILMRYFENRQLGEIAGKLGLSEDAARKRVERALDRLRGILSRRGITTSASFAAALSANAVQMAPAGLASTLATGSLAGTAAGTGATVTLLKLMTMSKIQMGVIGVLVAGGIATPVLLQYRAQAELRETRAALRHRTDEAADQAAETERLSNLLAQANSARQLDSGQGAELLRLRSEVGSLRRQTNDLARLQSDNARLRAAAASRAGTQAPTTQDKAAQEYVQRDSWAFAGYADPESAFQSAIWAMSTGDAKTFVAGLSPDGQDFKDAQAKSESELAAENKAELQKVTAYKIIDKAIVSDAEVILTVYAQGENATTKFRLQRFGDQWKVAGPVKGDSAAK
jgi:RNA polymerase sigma factor (sigma-70 family)